MNLNLLRKSVILNMKNALFPLPALIYTQIFKDFLGFALFKSSVRTLSLISVCNSIDLIQKG